MDVWEFLAKAWSMVACCRAESTDCSSTCLGSFERGHHYLHYFHYSVLLSRFSRIQLSATS